MGQLRWVLPGGAAPPPPVDVVGSVPRYGDVRRQEVGCFVRGTSGGVSALVVAVAFEVAVVVVAILAAPGFGPSLLSSTYEGDRSMSRER